MLNRDFQNYILALVIACTLIPQHVIAQDALVNPADFNEKFQALIENPTSFTSDERVEIYLQEISKQLTINMDSAYVGYAQMIEFGNKIKDSLVIGIAYNSQASIQKMKGDYISSLGNRKIAEKYLKSHPKHLSNVYSAVSSAFIVLNQLDSAEIYFEVSEKLMLALKDSLEYTNRHITRAQIYNAQHRYSSAIESYQNALKYVHLAPSRLREIDIYNHISILYMKFGDIDNSIFYLNKGLDVAKEQGYKSTMNKLMLNIGRNKMKQGKYQEALQIYTDVLVRIPEGKVSRITLEIHCLLTLAAVKLNNQPLANKYHIKMMEQYSTTYTRYHDIYHLTNGHYYLAKNDFKKATDNALQVVNSSDPLSVIKAYKVLAEINQKDGNWRLAYAYQDSVLKVTSRSSTLAQQNIIYDFESKYQKTLQEKEISLLTRDQEIQNMKLSRQSRMLYFSLFGLFLAALAVLGIIYAYRTKIKSNQLLKDKNSKLSIALENNKMLIKEIHHRVKNNLQVVSSLLNLQSRFEKDSTIVKAINTGKYRVQSMSLLHQNLYVNEDLKSIHIKKYFEDLANTLVSEYPLDNTEVEMHLNIEDLELDIDTVVPLGLIGNELITNAMKYAFNGRTEGNLHFSITEIMGKIRMKVSDDGVGMPFNELPLKNKSMGYQLVQSFAKKIKADIKIDNTNGTSITLVFDRKPKLNSKERSNVAS